MFENQKEYFKAATTEGYQKPVVQYVSLGCPIVVGGSAIVVVKDHPAAYLNDADYVHTSRVMSYDEATGKFETRNTLYVPMEA